MTGQPYSDAEWEQRLHQMRAVIQLTTDEMASIALSEMLGEDAGLWTDRVYARLESLPPRDLAVMVVILLHEAATDEANRLWSAIHTMIPEDVA